MFAAHIFGFCASFAANMYSMGLSFGFCACMMRIEHIYVMGLIFGFCACLPRIFTAWASFLASAHA
jgi:hypothetical protein